MADHVRLVRKFARVAICAGAGICLVSIANQRIGLLFESAVGMDVGKFAFFELAFARKKFSTWFVFLAGVGCVLGVCGLLGLQSPHFLFQTSHLGVFGRGTPLIFM